MKMKSEKKLYYDLSPEALRLAKILTNEFGTYRKLIDNKWVLDPTLLNEICDSLGMDKIWVSWQDLVRQAAYLNQNGKSLLTGVSLNSKSMHLHHAVITKGTIRGLKGVNRNLIHHTYNCMVISPNEHLDGQNKADNRAVCVDKLKTIYRVGLIKMWYFGVSGKMKSKLPNVFYRMEE